MAPGRNQSQIILYTGAVVTVIFGLYASSLHSYLLFHTLVEFSTIAIACTLFILTWNTGRFHTSGYLKLLGIGYGLIALVDLLHTLAYKGMGLFPASGVNLATQLWIAARFLQAVLLCVAPLFTKRNTDEHVLFAACLAAVSMTTALVYLGVFPDCFIEGKGLTPFKIISEYVISAMLVVALMLFTAKRTAFSSKIFTLIFISILCSIGSELAFTRYLDVYGPANMAGHFLKLAAFFLIYHALVVTGLKEPFELIFRNLKQTEDGLMRQREFSRCLLESMADGVVACDADGTLTLFNRTARDWHGMDATRLPAQEWTQYYDLFRSDGVTPLPTDEIPLAMAFKGKTVENTGMAIVAKGQPTRFILTNGSVITDASGQKLGAVVVMRDITAIRNLEQELRQANENLETRVAERTAELQASEQKYRELIQKIQAAVIVQGADTSIVTSNMLAQRLLGLTEAQLTGKAAMDQAWHFIREDGSILPQEDYPASRVLTTGESLRDVVLGIHRPGTEKDVWVQISADPVRGQQGDVTQVIVTFVDITERSRIENFLQKTAKNLSEAQRLAHIGSWELDLSTNILTWSDEIYRIFEIDQKQFGASYEAFLAAIHPDDREAVNSAYTNSLKNHTPYAIEHRLLFSDGRIKHVHEQCESFYENDKPTRSTGTVQDITERKQAESELRKLNEELEELISERTASLEKKTAELLDSRQALMNMVEDLNEKSAELEKANRNLQGLDRLKSMFIASMSHELRTPLNSIIGFSSMVLDEWFGKLNEEQQAKLAIVLKAGKHLLTLINDVIDVSKIEAGKIEFIIEDFDIADLVSDALELVRKDCNDKGLSLEVETGPLILHTDRRRLFQCLVNLLTNAVKFTEQGTVSVKTALLQGNEAHNGSDYLQLTVSDTGIGIAIEDQSRLFIPFSRIESHPTLKVQGTGLGLYLVKKITGEILHGEVGLTSSYGKGSSFSIKIPLTLNPEGGIYENSTRG